MRRIVNLGNRFFHGIGKLVQLFCHLNELFVFLPVIKGVYYSVLENGTVLPEEVTPTDIGPTLNNWEEDEKLVQMAKQLNKLSDSVKKSISEIIHIQSDQPRI